MALKETLAYYLVDGGTAFCTFLDATKAFDRVDHCKLFRELIKRDVPAIHHRLLLNMYTNSVARICWNGVFSQFFCVQNGVKQGGIVSPVLFCMFVDGLLQRLRYSKIGCWIGSVYVGVLAYADDVTLLAPTPRAMRLQLQICEDYAREYRIVFNATKSATMFTARRKVRIYDDLQFFIDGKRIPTVGEFPHLGHIVTSTLDEKSDILAKKILSVEKLTMFYVVIRL